MNSSYSVSLVLLSIVVAVIASYVAIDLASRVAASTGTKAARYWLVGGALSLGVGIWSMHFIGMLALRLPIPMSYSVPTTVLSLAIACLVSGFALFTINHGTLGTSRLLGGGALMGTGIAAMHYTGMAAMEMQPPIRYDSVLLGLSVLVAISASIAALWIAFRLRHGTMGSAIWARTGSALVMGAAISGMHYTGMAAAQFAPDSVCTVSPQDINNTWLAGSIGVFAFMFLATTLLISVFDVHLANRSAKFSAELQQRNVDLSRQAGELALANELLLQEVEERARAQRAWQESETRFRSAFDFSSIGIALVSTDGRWLQVNNAICRILGYSESELLALTFQEITHPEDLAADLQYVQQVLDGQIQTYQMEKRYLHREGRTVWALLSVSLVRSEDGLPVYFISQIQDISARKQYELAIELSERFLHVVIDSIPQPLFVKDSAHRWVLLNQSFCNMLGRERTALLGRSDPDIYPAELVERVWAEDDRALAMQEPLFVESAQPGPDGKVVWLLKSKQRVDLPDGAHIVGIFTDITPQKQVEQALRASEESHRLLAENSSDMILRITPEGTFTYVSPASLGALGYRPEELVGGFVPSFIHPDDREEASRLYGEVVRRNVVHVVTCRLRRRDGTWAWMETSFRAVRDQSVQRTVQVIGVSRNVDERVHATEALNRFKYVLDHTLDMIYIFDEVTLRFTYANQGAAAALGYSREKLLGMAPWELRPDMTEAQYRKSMEPFLNGEIDSRQFETVHRRVDGTEFPADVTMQLMRRTGEPGVFIAVIRDASERKKIDRMKSEFVSTVSHELRTPLTSIRGSLGLIAGGAAGVLPEQVKSLITIAHNNSERLVRLINDILDMEKIESGKMRFDLQPQRVEPLLTQAMEANRAYAEQLQVRFALIGEIPEAIILADSDRFMQIMANLLSNAAKFSPSPGVVELSADRAGATIRISVTDHGPGIPEEFRPKIFGKFSQADSTNTRQKGGTGLGLSIVKAIVEKHGGQIEFETHPSHGTTFRVSLPELSEASAGLVPEVARRAGESRVLVCEDDPETACVIATLLHQSGFKTEIASTLSAARTLLASQRYVAVTLDLLLPDGDGIELIRELRRDGATCALPVVVVSVDAENGRMRLNGAPSQVVAWLDKPLDHTKLIESVRQSVAGARGGKVRILHVEDDPDVKQVVSSIAQELADFDFASGVEDALSLARLHPYSLVILDLELDDGSGWELLAALNDLDPPPPVIVFSAQSLDAEQSKCVAATLTKANTSNQQLLEVIERVIALAETAAASQRTTSEC